MRAVAERVTKVLGPDEGAGSATRPRRGCGARQGADHASVNHGAGRDEQAELPQSRVAEARCANADPDSHAPSDAARLDARQRKPTISASAASRGRPMKAAVTPMLASGRSRQDGGVCRCARRR